MWSEDEASNAAGGEEADSDWVDETSGSLESSHDRWKRSSVALADTQPLTVTDGDLSIARECVRGTEAPNVAAASELSINPTRRKKNSDNSASQGAATLAGGEKNTCVAAGVPATLCGNTPTPYFFDGTYQSPSGTRKVKQKCLHAFRCKGFTFEWGGDAAADIPAYDLSPSFKLLRLSLDASVDDPPADVLRGFFRTFTAAGDAMRSDMAAGSFLMFHAAQEGDAVPANAKEKGRGGGYRQRRQALAAAYFAPLGDELHVGRSPQRLQLLGPNRFIGTINVTAARPSSSAATVGACPNTSSTSAAVNDRARPDAAAVPSAKHAKWEKEQSFTTWHRNRVIGAAEPPGASGAIPSKAKPKAEEEEEAVAVYAAADDEQEHGRVPKKKKKKAKREHRDDTFGKYREDAYE